MRRSQRHAWLKLIATSALFVSACGGQNGTNTESLAPGGAGGLSGGSGGSASGGIGGSGGTIATGGASGASGAAGVAGTFAGSGGMSGVGASGIGGAGGSGGAIESGGTGGAAAIGGAGGAGGMDTGGMGGMGGAGGMAGMEPMPAKKFCGNITTRGRVPDDFVEYWDQITPENEGKWGSVEANRDDMSWAGLDAIYAYSKEHGIPFKQHTFVWGAQQPAWIDSLSPSEQRAEVEEWIRLFCERYPDTQMIDVVNEPPPHTRPSYANAIGGDGASGYDWIVQSFEWADQYCPNAILILNDYNTIELSGDNNHFIDIVKRIQAAGAPIDAVGVQAHGAHTVATDTVRMFIDKMASETGLPVYVSEYDINIASDDQQRDVMESQMTMFWNNENVAGITLWGYVEGSTWLANTGIMSSTGEQRPAMTWLMDFLGR